LAWDTVFNILKNQTIFPRFKKRWEEAEALVRWEQAVGPMIAKHARALRVEKQVLWVEVDHPIWKSELHHRKRQILDILNGTNPSANGHLKAPEQVFTDLFFVEPRPKPPRTDPTRSRRS
jgi:EAL domain-containing protein (putative c-di-GMP-specific phosphodiesterase class I)